MSETYLDDLASNIFYYIDKSECKYVYVLFKDNKMDIKFRDKNNNRFYSEISIITKNNLKEIMKKIGLVDMRKGMK